MPDVVPHEIEPAESAGGAAHDRAGEIVLAQIPDQALGPPAGGGDFADDGIYPGLVDVDDADRRPFAGKAQRTRSSHPGSRRGDDPDLAFEPHGYPSTLAASSAGLTRRCLCRHRARRAPRHRPCGPRDA